MTSEELARTTNRLLQNITRHQGFNLKPEVYEQIKNLTYPNSKKQWYRTAFNAPAGERFRLPLNTASIPYITDIRRNQIKLETLEPKNFRLSSGSVTGNEEIQVARALDYKSTIETINNISFRNGIDLDNFTVQNISPNPLSRDQLSYILGRGAIVPLDTNSGVYVPSFGLSGNYFSYEYEGRFQNLTTTSSSFEHDVRRPVKERYGVDITSLMNYNISGMPAYRSDTDGSVDYRRGRNVREIVMGAASMSNLIYATHLLFGAWDQGGLIHDEDRVMDRSAGMHISTNLYKAPPNGQQEASTYINHVGTLLGALARTGERWDSEHYLGLANRYDANRRDFRIINSRLELRYPGTVLNTGYVANQLAFAGKIVNDIQLFFEANRNNPNSASVATHITGSPQYGDRRAQAEEHFIKPLHGQGSPEQNTMMDSWFNSFLDTIGIVDPFEKQFVRRFNKACSATRAPRP